MESYIVSYDFEAAETIEHHLEEHDFPRKIIPVAEIKKCGYNPSTQHFVVELEREREITPLDIDGMEKTLRYCDEIKFNLIEKSITNLQGVQLLQVGSGWDPAIEITAIDSGENIHFKFPNAGVLIFRSQAFA